MAKLVIRLFAILANKRHINADNRDIFLDKNPNDLQTAKFAHIILS